MKPVIAHAFSAMQAVWDLTPSSTPPLPVETRAIAQGRGAMTPFHAG